MDPMAQLRNEHSLIIREMDGIGKLFLDPDPKRFEELRERLRGLWILVLRHERFEEEWIKGLWRDPPAGLPGSTVDSVHREHREILSYLSSLEETIRELKSYPFNYWRRTADRETLQAQVEQIFRFVREHIERENETLIAPRVER